MRVKPVSFRTNGLLRRRVAAMALCAGLAGLPAIPAYAQVNIDQGKTPAEIYASDCATCHKTPRGLAVGKNSLMLSSFLREHYTASSDQAAALAAYVLSSGGREAAPAAAKPKPGTEHARAEEAKPGARDLKPGEPKSRAVRATSAKPEEPKPAKPEQATSEAPPASDSSATEKPEDNSSPAPVAAPAVAAPAVAAPAANAAPAVAIAEPQNSTVQPKTALAAVPNIELGSTTTAVAPAHQSNAGPTVPRDKIPD